MVCLIYNPRQFSDKPRKRIMLKPAAFLALLIFSATSSAQIFKCIDPKTQKINFTDKPCDTQERSTEIKNTRSQPSHNTRLSLEKLDKRFNQLDWELTTTHFIISSSRTRFIPHPEVKKLSDVHRRWEKDRDKLCESEHRIVNLPDKHNQQLLLCKVDASERRIKEYLRYPMHKELTSRLEAALDGENILESIRRDELPPGRAGLEKGVKLGLLTKATQMEIFDWKKKAGITEFGVIMERMPKYVIRKRIKLSGGLGGANSVIFLVPSERFMPTGDAGHSLIISMKDGSCIGHTCDLLD